MERNAKQLLQKYLEGSCTEEERELVERYMDLTVKGSGEWPLISKMKNSLEKGKNIPEQYHSKGLLLMPWKRYGIVAAACLLLLSFGLSYFYFSKDDTIAAPLLIENDAIPGRSKAILVLGDGRRVNIDEIGADSLINATGVQVYKSGDGEISYRINPFAKDEPVIYNEVITPKGGIYTVVLPDSTKVRLNASTTIRYPNRFIGAQRVVELVGEAFFEVKSNSSQPFIVKSKGQEVQVIGTKFNIQAYGDEARVRTSLAEGKVNLKNVQSGFVQQLTAGQRGEVSGKVLTVENIDLIQDLAWLDNTFIFKGTPIREILSELSRWYDVEFDVENLPDETFYATLPRTVMLSKVLSALEQTSSLKFTIQGRRVKVL